PELPKEKVYWLQPVLVNGADKAQWLAVEPWEPSAPPLERRPALLAHKLEAGERKVQLGSKATVTVLDGIGKPYLFNIDVQADLDETVKTDKDADALSAKFPRVQIDIAQ